MVISLTVNDTANEQTTATTVMQTSSVASENCSFMAAIVPNRAAKSPANTPAHNKGQVADCHVTAAHNKPAVLPLSATPCGIDPKKRRARDEWIYSIYDNPPLLDVCYRAEEYRSVDGL